MLFGDFTDMSGYKPHFVVVTPGVLHPMQLVAKIENDPVYLLQPVFDQLEWDWRHIMKNVVAKWTTVEFLMTASERTFYELQLIERNWMIRKFNRFLYSAFKNELFTRKSNN